MREMRDLYKDVLCPKYGKTERVYLVPTITDEGKAAYVSNGCDDMDGSKTCHECRIAALQSFIDGQR